MNAIQEAREALLKIWPRGKDCEHVHAKEAFEALDRAMMVHDELKQRYEELRRHYDDLPACQRL